jgi:methyl-accepting chemotaxis protein
MKKIVFKHIKTKLITLFLLISLAPLGLVAWFSYVNFKKEIETEVLSKLHAVVKIKTDEVKTYFKERFVDLDVLSKSGITRDFLTELEKIQESSNLNFEDLIKSQEYGALENKSKNWLSIFEKGYGYEDIFFIDHNGNIVYSLEKESDFGTNVKIGKYSDSNLAKGVVEILNGKKEVVFKDFELYAPSNNAPAGFIAQVIYDENNEIHGVLAFQISIKQIDAIMNEHTGLGKTGETYLVGPDYLMRSNSRFEEQTTILKKKIDTFGVRDVFSNKGNSKELFIHKDYRGISVIAFREYLKQQNWALMCEVDEAEAFAPLVKLRNLMILFAGLIACLVCMIAIFIAEKIAKPVKNLVTVSTDIANGDLTKDIALSSSDEIGDLENSFKTMVKGLSDIITKIQDSVSKIGSAATEISAASQQQAAGAREQSSAISETTAAAQELTTSAGAVGENSKKVSLSASHSMEGMSKLKEELKKTGEIVSALSEKSQKIGKITELIDDVTDQTNLLAVNAAIEAKRAGEYGLGFSVVADEIRKLSDSTANSTKEITSLIELIQNEMSNAIMSMETSFNSVEAEVKSAGETENMAKEISMSVNQQINGSKQIAEAMSNIDEAMKQIVSGTQQSEVSAGQLTQLGEELKAMASNFKVAG